MLYGVTDYTSGAVAAKSTIYTADIQRNAVGVYEEVGLLAAGDTISFIARGTSTLAIDNASIKQVWEY